MADAAKGDVAQPPTSGGPARPDGASDWQVYRRLLRYVADQKRFFLLAIVGFLVAATCEAGFATVLGVIVDTFKADGDGAAEADERLRVLVFWALQFGWAIPVAMLVLALLRGLGSIAGEYLLSRISFRAIHVIRCQLFDALLAMPSAFYDKRAHGHLVSRLTFTAAQLRDSTTDALKIIVQDGLKVIVLISFMLYLNWMLTVIFLVLAPAVGMIVRYASRRFRRISKRIQDSMGDVTHVASEAVAAYREVKVYGGEDYERHRFTTASDSNRRQNLKMTATKATSAQVIQLLAAGGLAMLVALLLRPEVAGAMTPGVVIIYLGAAGMLANPIKRLSDVNARLQRGLAAAVDIFEQLDQDAEDDAGSLDIERVEGAIRFDDVSFGYDDKKPPVVADISFSVQPGQTVALVGRSGSGKSTLASLIARFYEPTSGRILLDGEPLARYRLACLRRQIALVPQHVTLFNDTLVNNIAYGGLVDADRESIDTAVRRAHANVFADRMHEGLDTVVGDDGVLLSGGERQRIAIARALLKDAPILILDEATSSLDAHAERHIQAALEEVMRDRTTIVIAHRLSTVEKADLILVVDDGRIVERGDHATLMAANGAYANLYRSHLDDNGTVQPPPRRHPVVPAGTRRSAGWLEPLVTAWYGGRSWPRLLMPLAALYGWIVKRRRNRFRAGKARSWRAPVPVIVVGNITAGGTGKTPLVIWLAEWLRSRGVRAGVVSRGYGGRGPYPLAVTAATPAAAGGDEAAMVARRADCPVVVDPDRPRAVRKLLESNEVDVVIADDGLQHYALRRDVEIAVVDGSRGLGNGLCLPAGPLREPASRLRECDWVVANGKPPEALPGASTIIAKATAFVNLATGRRVAPDDFTASHGRSVLGVAGVGNPSRFQSTLSAVGLSAPMRTFPDHHRFVAADLVAGEDTAVVVTEKDAEKIKHLDGVGDHCWYVEIEMEFAEPVDEFLEDLLRSRGVALGGTTMVSVGS
ncbi:MAG: lipid A export permease/ATP-binding protein MsbA [Gammaproteobacteria bacterium]|nr:lipid A export permease/ATP-binding protein MsbA [Gammaproteobacteria bacterium]MYK46134.1 lipid A export permease/ATP-binding protein MsbA [Gammaproteobacteria bacterium]